MAKVVAKAFDPKSGLEYPVYDGFSWWALIFGFLFLLYKAAYLEAAIYVAVFIGISLVAAPVVGSGVGITFVYLLLNLAYAAMANAIVANSYVRKGFLTEKQWLARTNYSTTQATPITTADEIAKLADLKERGLLSADEYQKLKSKIID